MAEYRNGYKVDPKTGLTKPEAQAGLTREQAETRAAGEAGARASAPPRATTAGPSKAAGGSHRTRWILGGIGGVILLVIILSAAFGSGGGSSGSSHNAGSTESAPGAPPPPPSPPPPPKVKSNGLTATERRWLSNTEKGSEEMSKALTDLSEKSTDVAALLTDKDTRIAYAVDLGVLESCSSLLGADTAPTARLRALTPQMKIACRHFRRAASLTARGLDNLDADMIERGARELSQATTAINKATTRFLAFAAAHNG
jgi:hypothetical protein